MINFITVSWKDWSNLTRWKELTGDNGIYFDCDKQKLYTRYGALTAICHNVGVLMNKDLPDERYHCISFNMPDTRDYLKIRYPFERVKISVENGTMTFEAPECFEFIVKNQVYDCLLRTGEERVKAENFNRICSLAETIDKKHSASRYEPDFIKLVNNFLNRDYASLYSGNGVMVAEWDNFTLIAEYGGEYE